MNQKMSEIPVQQTNKQLSGTKDEQNEVIICL